MSSCTRRKFSRPAESCAAPAEVNLEIREADALDIAEHQTQLSHAEDLNSNALHNEGDQAAVEAGGFGRIVLSSHVRRQVAQRVLPALI